MIDPQRLLAALSGALRANGKLLITVPDETYVDTLGEHLRTFTRESLEELLKSQFKDYEIAHVEAWYFAIARKGE